MNVSFSKNFVRKAENLDLAQRKKLFERLLIFRENPLNPVLRNHQLKGKYKSYRSVDIAGDLRALYTQRKDEAVFDNVGTHSQLY